jgi:hypothetical protein
MYATVVFQTGHRCKKGTLACRATLVSSEVFLLPPKSRCVHALLTWTLACRVLAKLDEANTDESETCLALPTLGASDRERLPR